jgi:hypothetical protein
MDLNSARHRRLPSVGNLPGDDPHTWLSRPNGTSLASHVGWKCHAQGANAPAGGHALLPTHKARSLRASRHADAPLVRLTAPAHLRRRASAQPEVNGTEPATAHAISLAVELPHTLHPFTAGCIKKLARRRQVQPDVIRPRE